MILPAKTPDGHSMPNIAKAFWPFFFFKKTFKCWKCVELLKRVKNFKEPDWNCGAPLLTRTLCSLEGFLRCPCFFSGGKACPKNNPNSPSRV